MTIHLARECVQLLQQADDLLVDSGEYLLSARLALVIDGLTARMLADPDAAQD